MRYLPTIDLWSAGIDTALRTGQLKLQIGQWVQCGEGPKSRWLGKADHSLWVAHFPYTSGQSFHERVRGYQAAYPKGRLDG